MIVDDAPDIGELGILPLFTAPVDHDSIVVILGRRRASDRALAHARLLVGGRCGSSSMSPTNHRANLRSTTDRFESGSARLAASSRRSHKSSSIRMRLNGVPGCGMVSALLLAISYPLCAKLLACSYSMPYNGGTPQAT